MELVTLTLKIKDFEEKNHEQMAEHLRRVPLEALIGGGSTE